MRRGHFQFVNERMSARQHGVLGLLEKAPRHTIGVDEVATLNQITTGACKKRHWVKETANKKGIFLTQAGLDALRSFRTDDFRRKVASMRFASCFDLKTTREQGGKR